MQINMCPAGSMKDAHWDFTKHISAYPLQDRQFGLDRRRMDAITLFAIFHAYPLLYLFSVPQQLEQ